MKNFVVTKSVPEMVGSSTPPAAAVTQAVQQIKLSSFDKALAYSPFTSFQVFTYSIDHPDETVRRGLARALLHYFPVAGRAAGTGDELRIRCTGEGVVFVAASANCSLEDVRLFDPPFAAMLRELAGAYPAPEGCCRPSDSLLLVQVTEFTCGGYVVGATWNHALADGTGMAQFLSAVAELARGLPMPSVFPVSCGDDTLPELPPLVKAIETTMVALPAQGFVYQDITVPWSLVNRIKADFTAAVAGDDGTASCCTVFEAVVAALWRCRTRVVMSRNQSDPGAPAPLVFAANVRKYVGARDGYYGNCITSAVVVPTCGEVANGEPTDVVRLIKRAKQGIPEQFFKKVAGAGRGVAEATKENEHVVVSDAMFGYNAFYVSSWSGLGFDAADFGGGRPARVMCHVELEAVPNCVACLPCKGKDGANVLALCVREEHAKAFLQELEELASSL